MQYEQNKINKMLPKGMKCYHALEFDDVPQDNYLIIMDINPKDEKRHAFKLELWGGEESYRCTQLFEPPLNTRRTWNGPYDFVIKMLLDHFEYLKDPKRYGYKNSS